MPKNCGFYLFFFTILTAFLASCDTSYHREYDYVEMVQQYSATCNFENDGSTIVVSPNEETDVGFVFYPGGAVNYDSYVPLMAQLASRGIKCFLVNMPADMAMLDLNAASKLMPGYPEISHWYLGGHSLGGAMASSYIAGNSGNFEGLILLAAYSTEDLTRSGLKVCSIYGSEDGVLNRGSYNKYKKNLPKDTEEHVIEGGNHCQFGNYGHQKGDKKPKKNREAQQKETVDIVAAFCGC